ncbi:hypothetical protein AB0E69_06425 [Kribbella sp. NPDC026611]|uniref:hypothetical protein n=1 Tax=Kribbella sp. NPDC026611 TaxID=3154911 RepID=UPI0033E7BF70
MVKDASPQAQLDRLTQELIAGFRDRGVERVEYVPALSPPYRSWVWLGTATDAQRDQLAADPELGEQVRRLAERAGITFQGVTVESQETVARDFAGNWFYRLR